MTNQVKELRQLILKAHLMNEDEVISSWEKSSKITIENRISAQKRAKNLIKDIRNDDKPALLELFLAEYGLSTDEGVALMWLAEALM